MLCLIVPTFKPGYNHKHLSNLCCQVIHSNNTVTLGFFCLLMAISNPDPGSTNGSGVPGCLAKRAFASS